MSFGLYPVVLELTCPRHGFVKRFAVDGLRGQQMWEAYFRNRHSEGCDELLELLVPDLSWSAGPDRPTADPVALPVFDGSTAEAEIEKTDCGYRITIHEGVLDSSTSWYRLTSRGAHKCAEKQLAKHRLRADRRVERVT